MSNMFDFVGIGKVDTVPSEQKIAAVDRGQRKMKGVSGRTLRHHLVPLVGANDFTDARIFHPARVGSEEDASDFYALADG